MSAILVGIKNLLASEKAIACGVLVICATVLVGLGHMTVKEWQDYTMVIAGIYVGGKTLQGAVTAISEAKVAAAAHEASAAADTRAAAADELATVTKAMETGSVPATSAPGTAVVVLPPAAPAGDGS